MKVLDTRNRATKIRREDGQTIALMAVAMVSVLAMAALAIDLTTLYVAHGEIQRAADAAALAGAKAFVDSGVTTSPSNSALQTLAQGMVVDYATAVAGQNKVAGASAQFINGTPQVSLSISLPGNPSALGNPNVTVTLQRTGLPLFFARIWGNSVASVSATAIAEAYNPAYSQTNTAGFLPAAPKCVKPILLPNSDPNQPGFSFVDPTTGAITAVPNPFIGETLSLSSACGGSGCNPASPPAAGQYLPMFLPDTHRYCPACSAGGNFQRSTDCCDGTPFDYGQCGVSGTVATWSTVSNPGGTGGATQQALKCLTHAPLQDSLLANNGLLQIEAGPYSQAHYSVAPKSLISTSDAIITVPLFTVPASWPPAGQQLTVVGFLQLFVNNVGGSGSTDFSATILNVIGCGNNLAATSAISGGGASPIPVRLIHN
jgi:Putative Flp pilus-assembly TadE/G-like